MQEKLFVTEQVLNSSHDMVDEVAVPKFGVEGVRPEAKKSWELKQEEFEKEWKYGSTSVFMDGRMCFVGDISHCGMEVISFNANKMRKHMIANGLKYSHMNYNDPPTYTQIFDKASFEKDQEMYEHDIYSWDIEDNVVLVKQYGPELQTHIYGGEINE